jgi:hypothetical protein
MGYRCIYQLVPRYTYRWDTPMDAVPFTASVSASLAPIDERSALRLSPLPPVSQPSFALTHPYVELVYASSLGPSAVAVARYFGRLLAAGAEPVAISAVALALELGMRSKNREDPLGRNSGLRHAIDRLDHERLVRRLSEYHLAVHTAVPAVSDRVRDKLPPAARHAHDHFVRVPSGNGADGASPDALRLTPLRLTPLRCTSAPSFALTHLYLELVYGPILGPTAVLVARNLGRRLAAASGPITVSVVAIAAELGLRASHDEPLGKQSPVRRAIDRLEHTHLVQWLAHDHLAVQTEAPVANDHTLARLPESAAEAHRDFLAMLHLDPADGSAMDE